MNNFHFMTGAGEKAGQRRRENGTPAKMHRREERVQKAETHDRVSVSLRED